MPLIFISLLNTYLFFTIAAEVIYPLDTSPVTGEHATPDRHTAQRRKRKTRRPGCIRDSAHCMRLSPRAPRSGNGCRGTSRKGGHEPVDLGATGDRLSSRAGCRTLVEETKKTEAAHPCDLRLYPSRWYGDCRTEQSVTYWCRSQGLGPGRRTITEHNTVPLFPY